MEEQAPTEQRTRGHAIVSIFLGWIILFITATRQQGIFFTDEGIELRTGKKVEQSVLYSGIVKYYKGYSGSNGSTLTNGSMWEIWPVNGRLIRLYPDIANFDGLKREIARRDPNAPAEWKQLL